MQRATRDSVAVVPSFLLFLICFLLGWKDGVMHVPTRDHLWANREVRLENHQKTRWFSSLTSRLAQRWSLVGTCIASSFRSYWERNEKQLKTRHYSYLTASGSFFQVINVVHLLYFLC